jgi:predicted phage gp36 major capsid-like protein
MSVTDLIGSDEAGDLIPEAERLEILKSLPAASAALTLGRRVNMSTRTEKQPVLSALPSAYWVDGDTGLKQTTKAEWDNKILTAEELAVIVPVPENIIADSNFDVWAEVRPYIVEAIGAKLDEAVLFGSDKPASFEDSVVEGADAAGHVVAPGDIDDNEGNNNLSTDIGGEGGVMSLVEEDGFTVNGFAARTGIKAGLRGLRDTNGGVLFQPSLQVDTPATLYGEPIFYVDQNGAWDQDVDLIAGDWSKLVVGIRQDITFKLFTEGVVSNDDGEVVLNLMQQDSVALRVVARYAYSVANPINRKNEDEESRYPFSVLGTVGS